MPTKPDRTHVLYAGTKKTQKPLTLVALVLDHSSSMGPLAQDARQFYNETVAYLKGLAEHQEVRVCRVGFDEAARVDAALEPVETTPPLVYYKTYGNTALFDGIGLAVETLRGATIKAEDAGREVAFLVIVVTDGEENRSRRYYSAGVLGKLLAEAVATGKWTIGVNLPPGRKDWFVRTFPEIGEGNVREWELSTRGLRETTVETRSGLDDYFAARSAGHTASRTLYRTTTDLSRVTAADLSKLVDVSAGFKGYPVDKEARVDEFVQEKTGKPLVIGAAYYQLTKPETVQQTKDVLVQEKGKRKLFGGAEARKVLGLPTDGDARVRPGNHANFDIFVQSRAANRKLVRGTKLYVQLGKTTADPATWQPTPTV